MGAIHGEQWPADGGTRDSADGGAAALLRDSRRAAGLTQQQLAAAAGVSVGALRDLEQDRTSRPRRETVWRLRAALGLNPDQPGDRDPGAEAGDAQASAAGSGDGAVRVCVLGPLEAWRGGVPVELGPARQRAVLGLLAVRPNVMMHRAAIVEALWDGNPPDSAVKMVQAYVGRLRRQLDPGRSPQDRDGVLISAGTRYRLHAGAAQLDLIGFEQLADRAQAARRRGDFAAACERYVQALSLWRGEPLADLDLLSAHPAVTGLARRHAEIVTDFAETAIEVGAPGRVLPYLWALAERDPLDERAHGWLMLALAGTGQQAAALAIYDRLRRRLDEQLGVRLGAELEQAYVRVLRQDVPAIRPQPARAMNGAAAPPPRQLPRDPGAFVGRGRECAALRTLAERAAGAALICMIDGGAGVGKTALAIHAGHQLTALFPDGQLHVDLRGFGPRPPVSPGEALTGFLRALGADPPAIPAAIDEQAAMFRSLLAGKRMLIVLDNAADPGQVRPLLPGTPGSLVLVTSRGRLPGLVARDGAARLTLEPLARDEATLLLGTILGSARVRAEPRAAADIAAQCGHLPLALRIAADRAAGNPRLVLADLAGQLAADDRLDMLDAGGAKVLIDHWDGTAWSVSSSFPGALGAYATGVADISPADAYAIGNNSSIPRGHLAHWDGTAWSSVTVPLPPNANTNTTLNAISADGPNDVWAVGTFLNSATGQSDNFTIHFNGTAWSVVPMPIAGGFGAIKANSPTDVWAVGDQSVAGSTNPATVTAHFNGTAWTVVPSPSPGQSAILTGVTTSNATNNIWAVGVFTPAGTTSPQTLTLNWNGTAWSVVASPNPASFDGLNAVATNPGAATVWAVGNTGQSGSFNPLVLKNG